MRPQRTWIRAAKLTLVAFVWLFLGVFFQMWPQIVCLRRGIVTLVAFIWLFSTVYFHMRLQRALIRAGKLTLVAFVRIFSTANCRRRIYNRPSFNSTCESGYWKFEKWKVKWKFGSLILRMKSEMKMSCDREWKVKWKWLKIEIESEKWNENALRSRSEISREILESLIVCRIIRLFSTMYFQMCPQTVCPKWCKLHWLHLFDFFHCMF